MTGDVTIMGLTHPNWLIEDIGVVVPHGQTVVISAEKAYRSKDLGRGISQKFLFPLSPNPTPSQSIPSQEEILRKRVHLLEEENRHLHEQLASYAQNSVQSEKLDAILALLHTSSGSMPAAVQVHSTIPAPPPEVVEIEAPPYIPSQIRPAGAEVHIDKITEASSGSEVQEAASTLRKLRRTQ